jgi:hypothetical protein
MYIELSNQVSPLGIDLTLTHAGYRKYLNWLGREKLFCERCGREIRPGDKIHRSGKLYARKNQWDDEISGNENCRFYHRNCFEELLIEC